MGKTTEDMDCIQLTVNMAASAENEEFFVRNFTKLSIAKLYSVK
jgi:hypothetical protein